MTKNVRYHRVKDNLTFKWSKVRDADIYVSVFNIKWKNTGRIEPFYFIVDEGTTLSFGKGGKLFTWEREYTNIDEITFSVYAMTKNQCGVGYQSEIVKAKF